MISGQVNQQAESFDTSFKASLGQVIMENGHEILHAAGTPVIAVPCRTDQGEFTIELCLPS